MSTTTTERCRAMQQAMQDHVSARLARALGKWEGKNDSLAKQEIKKAQEKYRLDDLLKKGANASGRIAVASHIAKATHPDLKTSEVTNPNIRFGNLPSRDELGSHVLLDKESLADTTGDGAYNAAAHELYLLLDLRFEGKTLGTWLLEEDNDAVAAFAGNHASQPDAATIIEMYAGLLESKVKQPAVNTKSKQLYWLVGDDPTNNADYHLLAPLYATSLAHVIYSALQEDRFSEANKTARQAFRERKAHDGVYRGYPNLAVQKLGGNKPQNISQLNSERRGNNYLLSCAPPVWTSRALRSPWWLSSIFDRIYGVRPDVRETVRDLIWFLDHESATNMQTRNRVDAYVDTLIDELVQLASEYQRGLEPGWTRDERVELAEPEQLWLDPRRAEIPEEKEFREKWLLQDWPAQIGHRFANWLNTQLEGRLPVGDAEFRQWKKELLIDEDDGGWAQQLHRLRKELDAPTYIPVREGQV